MDIYQVGPDMPYGLSEDQKFAWVVIYYENGGYDGQGEAVALCKDDGLLYIKNLGHCSCYGPMDDGLEAGGTMTVEKFLEDKEDIISYDAKDVVKEKVSELLR